MTLRTILCIMAVAASPLAAAPRISEFMASNDRSITDEDGDFSDWIEIHNPDPAPVDLSGHFLTDDPNDLTRWSIPAGTVLGSDACLIVFASGKDRAIAGAELHTDFQLDAGGESLALVAPDGTTLLSAFDPYPTQRADISYGAGEAAAETTLVADGAPLRYRVPADAAALDPQWNTAGFDDGGWSGGTSAVGFDREGAAGPATLPLDHWPLDDGIGGVARDTAGAFPGSVIGGATWSAEAPAAVGGPESSLRFDGANGYVNTTFPGIGGSASRTVVFWVRTSDTTDHGIVAWGDSTANGRKYHIRINTGSGDGTVGAIRCEIQNGRTVGSTVIADNQWHHVAVVFEEDANPSQADVEFYIDGVLDPKSGTADLPLDTDISGASAVDVSIGRRTQGSSNVYFDGWLADVAIYDTALAAGEIADLADGTTRPAGPVGFGSLIATDLEAAMHGANASAFTRASFSLPANFSPDQLGLRLRYDAGFIAFLNGVEIARANAPATGAWNSVATAERDNRDAIAFAEFSASAAIGVLDPATNVLAVQGMNSASSDDDFLLGAELVGAELGATVAGYFLVPTPGAPNGEPDADAFVADTKFSIDRGFFDASFDLAITTATPDADIYYTLDGSEPSPTNGTLYAGPITISETETVRAAAFKAGQIPTNIDTHSYLFPDTSIAQPASPPGFPASWGSRTPDYEMDPDLIGPIYSAQEAKDALRSLPTISMVMDLDDLFSGATGFYANSGQRGDQWEKRCSFEFIDFPDANDKQLNGGIRIVGRASRSANRGKHHMRAVFRSEYGPKKLRFPLFPDTEVDEFNSLILRGGNGDSWTNPGVVERAQYIRDQWHRDAQRATGQPFQHQIYAHLYINGLYWGMFHVFERFEDDMLAEHFGGEEEEWDAIKDAGSASALEVVDGDLVAWNETLALSSADLTDPANYAALLEYIDPDIWIDYFLTNFYSGNTDWDQSNWRAGRMRKPGAKWMLFAWDSERTDRNATAGANSSTNNVTGKNVANFPSRVHQNMTASPEYRLRFADRVRLHCFNGGTFTPEGAAALWDARADAIYEPLIVEAARWGDRHRNPAARRESPWQNMLDTMHSSFFPQRTNTLLGQLRARNLYPNVDAPELVPHGAAFPAPSSVAMTAPSGGTIYYTLDGSDPRTPGNPGTSTVLLAEDAPVTAFIPTDGSLGLSWTAPAFNDAGWTSGSGGVGYENNAGFDGLFGIDLIAMRTVNPTAFARWEFHIPDQATLDAVVFLTLRMKYDDGFVAYLNGVRAASANEPATLAWNSSATSGHADGAATVFENFDATPSVGALVVGNNVLAVHCLNTSPNSSDLLMIPELVASTGSTAGGLSQGAVAYAGSAVAVGASARVNARVLDNGTWSALTTALYTVGEPAGAGDLAITEIMYHPVGDAPLEFVEVTNISDAHLDLSGVAFTAGIDFAFPETANLPPGASVLVVEDLGAFEAAHGTGLPVAGAFAGGTRLANGGEQLVLAAADGSPIRDFEFDDRHPWPAIADGDGKSLVLIDPASDPDHGDPLNWRASVTADGNPGGTDTMPFVGGDAAALLAYALADPRGVAASASGGTFALTFQQNLAADDAQVWAEFSTDLVTWTVATLDEFLSRDDHLDGTATLAFASPLGGMVRQFARVRVEERSSLP